jgi:hypothetical protein
MFRLLVMRPNHAQPAEITRLFVSRLAQPEYPRCVRVDAPLPGDLVIRCRRDDTRLRRGEVFVITHWPDPDTTVGGPYQSYGYALRQAHGMLKDRSERIWYDHAPPGRPEQLEQVGGHGHT